MAVPRAVPPEEAFAFHVPLSMPFFSNLWTAGRRREVPDWRLGDAQLIDLRDKATVSLDIPFDSLRFYIPQTALNEMANEAGIRLVKGLHAPNFGARDLIMFGLAQALAGAMEQPGDGTALVFRLYRARLLRPRCASLRQCADRGTERPWRPRAMAAAARPRLHQRQFSGRSFDLRGRERMRTIEQLLRRAFKETTNNFCPTNG